MEMTTHMNLRSDKLQLLPIVVTIAIIFVFWQWYFHTVDNEWLVNNMIASQVVQDDLGEQEAELLKGIISPGFLKFSTITGELGGLAITLVLLSAYVTLFTRFKLPKHQQLGMVSSINITAKGSLFVAGVHLLHALYVFFSPENKVNLYQVDFLALNNLGLMLSPDSPFYTVANAVSMNSLLFIGCCALLLHKKIKLSMEGAVLVYAAPYVAMWFLMCISAVI